MPPRPAARTSVAAHIRRARSVSADANALYLARQARASTHRAYPVVPAEVLVDNQKVAVIAHRRGGDVPFHPRFLDLAGHGVGALLRPARLHRFRRADPPRGGGRDSVFAVFGAPDAYADHAEATCSRYSRLRISTFRRPL
jgi:hypothetical protein